MALCPTNCAPPPGGPAACRAGGVSVAPRPVDTATVVRRGSLRSRSGGERQLHIVLHDVGANRGNRTDGGVGGKLAAIGNGKSDQRKHKNLNVLAGERRRGGMSFAARPTAIVDWTRRIARRDTAGRRAP